MRSGGTSTITGRRRCRPLRLIGSLLLGFAVMLAAIASSAAQGSPPPALSLDEIVAAALAHNPRLAASRGDVDTARRGAGVAQSLGVPKIGLAGGYYDLSTPGFLPPVLFAVTPEITQHLGEQGGAAGVLLTVPLYTGGRIPLQVRVAELGTAIAEHTLGQTEQDLIFNLSSLYYTALRLDADVVATQQSVKSLQSARDVVGEFVNAGKAPRLDLLRVEARLANVSQDLIRVQDAGTVSRAGIAILMGVPADTPIRLAGALADPLAAPPPALRDVPALTARALQQRPEYLAMLAQERQQEERVKLARAQFLPEVDLGAGYGAQAARSSATQGVGKAVVGITLPLFDATLAARVRQEESALATIRHRVDDLRLAINLEVEKAVVAIQDATARVRAAEAGVAQAQEALRDEQLKVQAGKGIVTDVLQAQAELLRAQVTDDAALADDQIARAQLQRAMGTLEAPRKTAAAQ